MMKSFENIVNHEPNPFALSTLIFSVLTALAGKYSNVCFCLLGFE